ncbi:MAG: metallophosphoesterase [Candidatus Heimdallarchaeota archaeon]
MTVKPPSKQAIVLHFLEIGYQLSPKALKLLISCSIPYQEIAKVVASHFPNVMVVDQALIQESISISSKTAKNDNDRSDHPSEDKISSDNAESDLVSTKEVSSHQARPIEFRILSTIPDRTPSKGGDASDFLKLFKDRFRKLRAILLSHPDVTGPVPSNRLQQAKDKEVEFIGMVSDIQENSERMLRFSLEDPHSSKQIKVLARKTQGKIIPDVLFEDSVIWVRGKINRQGSSFHIGAYEISKPGIPVYSRGSFSNSEISDSCVALISDIHVGNKEFEESRFHRFLDLLLGKNGDKHQQELASKITHIVIAGDLVDGVGVYPGQEEELELTSLKEQYLQVSELLGQIPPEISLIIIPGNHDATRLALPQPPFLKEFAEPLYDLSNATILGNPSFVEIGECRVLIAHGNGLERIIQRTSASFQKPIGAMIELLEHRHLCPVFGERTPIAPEWEDYLVIDNPPPHIFVAGHLHVFDRRFYRGVQVCIGGTFQRQSTWLKQLGIEPTVGIVPIFNLKAPSKFDIIQV